MAELSERDWRRLIKAIQSGKCILVLGPDASLDDSSGQKVPVTKNLARHLIGKMGANGSDLELDDPHHVAQAYLRQNDKDRFDLETEVEDFYAVYSDKTSEIHLKLASLSFTLCMTTCHDKYLQNAFEGKGKSPVVELYDFQKSRPAHWKIRWLKIRLSMNCLVVMATRDPWC